jgi:hypothetical protein
LQTMSSPSGLMHREPVVRSPLTDFVGNMFQHQHFGRCSDFEISMMECMEAYGMPGAEVKCRDLIDDFKECHYQTKQVLM